MLTGYYDLERCPPSFDVVSFLLALEQERIRRGDRSVEIEILPGPIGGFRADNLWPRSVEERRRMRNQIVVPMCVMLPSCTRVSVYDERPTRKWPSFGYATYSMQFKNFVHAIGKGIRPLRPKFGHFPHDPSLITLTLREAEHWRERNSKVEEWRKAAIALQSHGYRVRVLRDTRVADETMAEVVTVPYASRDLEARANLYLAAACNVFVSNGPAWFAMALDAPVIIMRPVTEGTHRLAGAENMKKNGIPIGGQVPGAPDHQRLVWEDDTAENIVAACHEFMAECRQRAA